MGFQLVALCKFVYSGLRGLQRLVHTWIITFMVVQYVCNIGVLSCEWNVIMTRTIRFVPFIVSADLLKAVMGRNVGTVDVEMCRTYPHRACHCGGRSVGVRFGRSSRWPIVWERAGQHVDVVCIVAFVCFLITGIADVHSTVAE